MLKEEILDQINLNKVDCFETWKNPEGDKITFVMWRSGDKGNRMMFEMPVAELRKNLEENF